MGLKFRHNLARDVLADMCYKAGVAVRKEATLGFLSDGSSSRPADIMVYNWENGKDICFDVTVVSRITSSGNFVPGQAISAAITRKRNKYLAKCASHRYEFGVLPASTLDELSDDVIVFIKRLKSYLASHYVNNKIGSSLFHRLGITIQKDMGAQLVARLPAVPV